MTCTQTKMHLLHWVKSSYTAIAKRFQEYKTKRSQKLGKGISQAKYPCSKHTSNDYFTNNEVMRCN